MAKLINLLLSKLSTLQPLCQAVRLTRAGNLLLGILSWDVSANKMSVGKMLLDLKARQLSINLNDQFLKV